MLKICHNIVIRLVIKLMQYACSKLKTVGASDRSRKCSICDKSGHLARDCRMGGQAQENQVAAAATLEVTREISAMELGPALQNVLARLVKVIFAR